VNKDDVGRVGEHLAAEFLADQGWQILATNWRAAHGESRASGERQIRGELDIVALHGATLVGVEVKTRSTTKFGHPAAAVTAAKIARLRKLLGQWVTEHRNEMPGFGDIRLDAIAIVLNPTPQLTHFKGISS